MNDTKCLRCGSSMQPGFQVDGIGRNSFRQSCWAEGPPQSQDATFWGIELFEKWALKLKEEDLIPIVTLRCSECGYLEQYAPGSQA